MTPYKLKILNGVLKLKSFADVVLNIFGIKDLGTQTGNVSNGLVDWSIQHLTKTTAQWGGDTTTILLKGQLGIEDNGTTTYNLKVGDGISLWSQLGYISGGNVFPEHLYLTVVNKTGDNLLASGYKVVKVSDAQGQRLAIDYAQANNDANSADTIGVVYENINNNQEGKIVTIGELTGLNTTGSLQSETWTDGDVLYLSPFTEGQITNIKPTAPNHLVTLGYVVYAHANNGKIYVKCDNGYEIGELHDVYVPSPNNNDGIFWSSGNTRYENKSIASALGYTPFKLLAKNNTPITHTGTATETLLLSYNLTGEFDLNDIVNISLFNLPTGSGSKTIRIKVNTTNDLTGATTLATYTATTTSSTIERTMYFSNTLSNVRVYAPTTSYASDRITSFAGSTTTTSVTYSFSGNVWILISVQLLTTTDTCVLHSLDITRKR